MTDPYDPDYNPSDAAWEAQQTHDPYAGTKTQIKTVAIFNFVLGGLQILWALVNVLIVVMALSDAMPEEAKKDPDVSPEEMALIYGLAGGVSLLAALVHIVGGLKMNDFSPDARGWGIACGVLGIVGVWSCCCFPLGLGFGIYTLVVMASATTCTFLEEQARQVGGQEYRFGGGSIDDQRF